MAAYKQLIRDFFSVAVKVVRRKRQMTQEEMAERLRISCRAYGDLERGKFSLSALALIFFLLMLEDNEVIELLKVFRGKVKALELQDAA